MSESKDNTSESIQKNIGMSKGITYGEALEEAYGELCECGDDEQDLSEKSEELGKTDDGSTWYLIHASCLFCGQEWGYIDEVPRGPT